MRELTRSMIRFSWAMPLLGVNQLTKLMYPDDWRRPLDSTNTTLEALSEAAYQQMGPRLQGFYDQGDQLQQRIVDAVFGAVGVGAESVAVSPPPPPVPSSGEPAQVAVEGWGPVPPNRG